MSQTPVIICFKSAYNNKYLRYKYEDVQTHGLLQFAAEKVVDPYAQFEVEKSKTYEGLVHLKSRYNNKYLVRWSPNHYWITASAHGKEEDQSKWNCTLFKPGYINEGDNAQEMRIMHVQLGHYASTLQIGPPFDSCLFAGSKQPDETSRRDVLTYVYWDSVLALPRRVAFKGNNNGRYLGVSMKNRVPYLSFSYDDPNDPMVAHEIVETRDGMLCVKSSHLGKFWRLGEGDWILADADDPRGSGNTHAMFRRTVLDVNVVALLNMYKTWFVKSFYGRGLDDCLNAAAQDVDSDAELQVIDLAMVCQNRMN